MYFNYKKVVLNSREPPIGLSLQGSVQLAGTGIDYKGDVVDINLKGDFECIVQDDTYSYEDFLKDIEKKYESKKE